MPDALIPMKKSSIGANAVVLVLDPAAGGPPTLNPTLVSVTFTYSGTPPAAMWGTTTTDGRAIDLHVRERT